MDRAVRSSLSIAGILLIFSTRPLQTQGVRAQIADGPDTWDRLWHSFSIFLMFMLPSLYPAELFSKVPVTMPDGNKPDWRTRRAYHLRGLWPLYELIVTSVFAITAIGIAAAGTNQSKGLDHMTAKLGKGTIL